MRFSNKHPLSGNHHIGLNNYYFYILFAAAIPIVRAALSLFLVGIGPQPEAEHT
jgi:hypothetical protein